MTTETLPTTAAPVVFKSFRPPKRYKLEEYLLREAKSKSKHEFIDGQIIRMPYAKGPHNIIAANTSAALSNALESKEGNYIVFSSDQKVYLPSLDEGVYADGLAVSEKPVYWDSEKLLLVNPLIVVEVLSKSTRHYDLPGKFDKYKTLPSFREYVTIQQDKTHVEVWFRERPGLWHETIVTDIEGLVPLQSVGLSLSMRRIYRNVFD